MKNLIFATASVTALDVNSQPDHAQIAQELLEVGEKVQTHLPYQLYNLGYAIRSGYSWSTVGEVTLEDVRIVFSNTMWAAKKIPQEIENYGRAISSSWVQTLNSTYNRQHGIHETPYGSNYTNSSNSSNSTNSTNGTNGTNGTGCN